MPWLRKIIFYIFSLTYLIICPLIVARMLGFVINPQTHRLVKTGLVYVSNNPPDANVYIDGRQAHQKTPTILRDLAPGKHFIRITLGDYNDWAMEIPVIGKKATVLANILLIPEEWPIKMISQKSYQNIILAGDSVLVASNPVLKDIDIFHTTQSIAENFKEENTYDKTPLFSKKSIYVDGQLLRLFNAPKSPFILLEAVIKDKHKFLWINLKETPPLIEDISDFFPEIPNRIAWDDSNNDNIFAFYQNNVFRINLKDKAIYPQETDNLPKGLRQEMPDTPPARFLINDKNDLLIREGAWIRLYPKEDFDTPQVYDIARSKPSTNMYFEEKNGELFYLDENSGSLFSAQILPYHPILNIPIPDALRTKTSKKENNP